MVFFTNLKKKSNCINKKKMIFLYCEILFSHVAQPLSINDRTKTIRSCDVTSALSSDQGVFPQEIIKQIPSI